MHRFRDIAGFVLMSHDPSSIPLILGVFSLDQIAHQDHVGVSVSRYLKLFCREICFEIFQPM